jgi:UDP-glucose 4-epimerase
MAELSKRYEVANADLCQRHNENSDIKMDVLKIDEVRSALKGADAVCHLAGLDLDRRAEPGEYLRVNVLGTWNVLQIAAEQRLQHVLIASSVAASGLSEMREDWPPQSLPVDGRHESRPTQAYGLSKLMVEQMTRSFVYQTGRHATCLRLMSVISDETIDDYLKFVEAPGRRWLFYYVTAGDAARAFSAALLEQKEKYGEFFVSAMDSSRMEPTLDWYEERIGPIPPSVDDDFYRANPRASVFSYSDVRRALGWEPTSDFLELAAARRAG